MSEFTRTSFIRKLKLETKQHLEHFLDPHDLWKKLIPNLCQPNGDVRYSSHHVDVIDTEGQKKGQSPTKILLSDWGTTNATVDQLLAALVQAKIYTAADYVSKNVLNEGPVIRMPEDQLDLPEQEPQIPDHPHEDISDLNPHSENIMSGVNFSWTSLSKITNNFDTRALVDGGNYLGKGGFGEVFYGKEGSSGTELAIKKFTDEKMVNSFEAETELCRLDHPNILKVLGFCKDQCLCIVYLFMVNGSLEDRLARVGDTPSLSVNQRMMIIKGVAEGLCYLHENQIIHRDVKSANVLLDADFAPKIGDFGIIKILPVSTVTSLNATSIFGSSPYMAPETSKGTVSVKGDTFAFGVLLLEVITSLKPYDDNREEQDLIDFAFEGEDDNLFKEHLLDSQAGDWNTIKVSLIIDLTLKCQKKYKNRPLMKEILPEISSLV